MKKFLLLPILGLVLACLGSLSGCDSGPADQKTQSRAVAETAPSPNGNGVPTAEKKGDEFPAGIVSITIMDKEVLQRLKPIVVTFTDPMVPEEALDKPVSVEDMPFRVHPAVPGEGRWLTNKSFVFSANQGFLPGKKYSLLFHEDLRALDGRPTRLYFSFTSAAPELRRAFAGAFSAANQQQEIQLDFSLPVRPEALAEHLEATDSQSGEKLGLDFSRVVEESDSQTVFVELGVFRPKIALTLRADQDGDAFPLGLSAPRSLHFVLPDPGDRSGIAKVTVGESKASPISLMEPEEDENERGELVLRFYLSEYLAADADPKEFIEVSPPCPFPPLTGP